MKYRLLSIIFLFLSLLGAIYLVKLNQDIRNKASCLTDHRCNNRCDYVFCGGCISGCREITDKTCNQLIAEECGPINNKWTNCTNGDGLTVSERCVTASNLDASLSLCPGTFPSNGCNDPNFTKNTSNTLCFKNNFCGAQQIDIWSPKKCWVHVEDHTPCITPTKIPHLTATNTPSPTLTQIPTQTPTGTLIPTVTPTITPIPTITPTPTQTPTGTLVPTDIPTNTPIPTQTPTGTVIPTDIPTNTPVQTQTPTGTLVPTDIPTNTPIPTDIPAYIAEGPSPTRIILPNAGVEFPIQTLTIVGVIVTLFGFLILL